MCRMHAWRSLAAIACIACFAATTSLLAQDPEAPANAGCCCRKADPAPQATSRPCAICGAVARAEPSKSGACCGRCCGSPSTDQPSTDLPASGQPDSPQPVAEASSAEVAQPPGRGRQGGRGQRAGRGMGRGGPGRGFGPGRGGDERFVEDHQVFQFLLAHHEQIRRTVKMLDTGVETITESDDPEIAGKIQEHVAGMYERVENVRPIHMRDPLFAEVFRNAGKIKFESWPTDKGIRVVETSDDPYVARLIQAHAKVVDLFVKNGFAEMPKNHAVPERPLDQPAAEICPECLQDAFVSFDRKFIPALALTNRQPGPATKVAVESLGEAWKELEGVLKVAWAADPAWDADAGAISQAIRQAQELVGEQQFSAAHEALEPVRDRLADVRRRNQVVYALDDLTAYHATMERIVKPAMSLTANQVSDEYRQQVAADVMLADAQWARVEQLEFSASVFRLTDEQVARVRQLIQAERQAISTLAAAVKSGEPEPLLTAARQLKPPFAQLYMTFGE